jgi:hypothetical protein
MTADAAAYSAAAQYLRLLGPCLELADTVEEALAAADLAFEIGQEANRLHRQEANRQEANQQEERRQEANRQTLRPRLNVLSAALSEQSDLSQAAEEYRRQTPLAGLNPWAAAPVFAVPELPPLAAPPSPPAGQGPGATSAVGDFTPEGKAGKAKGGKVKAGKVKAGRKQKRYRIKPRRRGLLRPLRVPKSWQPEPSADPPLVIEPNQ